MTTQPARPLRILMVSALEVWALAGGGGAPSLLKTLEGYGRRGHHIDFVTSRVGANHHYGAPVQEPPHIEGVTFHTFDLPSLAESRLPLPSILRKADQKLRFAVLFPYLAARRARRLLQKHDYDLFYGYEVHGVLAQRMVRRDATTGGKSSSRGGSSVVESDSGLGRETILGTPAELGSDAKLRVETRSLGHESNSVAAGFNPQDSAPSDGADPSVATRSRQTQLPLVARFQGTVMRPYLGRWRSVVRKLEEVVALKTPADLYVMTNDGTQGDEVLDRLNPRSQGKVRFWRNGIDLNQIRPPTDAEALETRQGLGLAPDDFVLVTSSRLARWKRIDRAVDAVEVLRRQHGIEAHLLIVGDGEEWTNLHQQVVEQGLEHSVTFVGAVPQSEVTRYLWAADVVLSVNELSNVGNPLLEAMLAGRCIVTLDEGDTRDVIKDGSTGVLLPREGAPVAIAKALADLQGSPEKRRQLSEGARAYAQTNFWSWQQRIDAELEAVEAICARTNEPVAAHATR